MRKSPLSTAESLDDGGDNESMSISNQKLMLRDFAEKAWDVPV